LRTKKQRNETKDADKASNVKAKAKAIDINTNEALNAKVK
jgi:hypothetical protein